MRIMRRIASVTVIAFSAIAFTLFGVANSASAMTQTDYNLVCQWQYNRTGAHAVNNGGNAYQWQCYVLSVNKGGLNLYGYCTNVMGMSNVQLDNVNDKYSWHCV